jgi:hypothetical protein
MPDLNWNFWPVLSRAAAQPHHREIGDAANDMNRAGS